jgi:predicted Rossmann fold flavoprotein
MSERVVIVGGGAAGFFCAIHCAETCPRAEVIILEKGGQFLQKVRISGGGRCNVTHACFDARELTRRYPRGERELIGPYHQFQAQNTVEWFEARGVPLKTEADGRIFPTSNSSESIVACLMNAAQNAKAKLLLNRGVDSVRRAASASASGGGKFALTLSSGEEMICDKLLLATGGCRTRALGALPVSLGHTLENPVPSLFSFHVELPWVRSLAGLSVRAAAASVPGTRLNERGPLLFTHNGLSGPCILRLSAWGARLLHSRNYQFPLRINWLENLNSDEAKGVLSDHLRSNGARLLSNAALPALPGRLWTELVRQAGILKETRCSSLNKIGQQMLLNGLTATELPVTGKSLNKDEFVTCGGVRLSEVNFKTMESKLCPGLYFAGELLDIDGITGGFNFQAAWTTGWLAAKAIARALAGEKGE